MKKLYTLLGAAFLVSSVSAQVYFGKDFEDGSITTGGCTTQLITGSIDWGWGAAGGNSYAKMSNYVTGTGNSAAETWYITPALDLSTATSPIFSMSSAANYTGDDITIYTSTDYDGTSNPNNQGTWTPITAPISTGNNYDWVNTGEVSVATSANTYFAVKYVGTAVDGKTWRLDSIFVAEAGTAFQPTIVVPTVPVYDIQYTTATTSPFDSPYVGQSVATGGIVTYVTSGGSFYMSSGTGPWSSIYVYTTQNAVTAGDSVTFSAQVQEYNGLTELAFPNNFNIVSSGNLYFSNAITTAEANTEAYESALVSVCGQATDVSGTSGGTTGFWKINDGSGDGEVDDFLIGNFPSAPVQGTFYAVKGLVSAYSPAAGTEFYSIQPRDAGDMQVSASQCGLGVEESTVNYAVYPNPANTNITIDVEGNHLLNITDISGKVVAVKNITGLTNISVAEFTAGIYFFNIEGNVTKVIVK